MHLRLVAIVNNTIIVIHYFLFEFKELFVPIRYTSLMILSILPRLSLRRYLKFDDRLRLLLLNLILIMSIVLFLIIIGELCLSGLYLFSMKKKGFLLNWDLNWILNVISKLDTFHVHVRLRKLIAVYYTRSSHFLLFYLWLI